MYIVGAGGRKIVPRFLLMEFIEVSNFFPANQIVRNEYNVEKLQL